MNRWLLLAIKNSCFTEPAKKQTDALSRLKHPQNKVDMLEVGDYHGFAIVVLILLAAGVLIIPINIASINRACAEARSPVGASALFTVEFLIMLFVCSIIYIVSFLKYIKLIKRYAPLCGILANTRHVTLMIVAFLCSAFASVMLYRFAHGDVPCPSVKGAGLLMLSGIPLALPFYVYWGASFLGSFTIISRHRG